MMLKINTKKGLYHGERHEMEEDETDGEEVTG
jgi:hypothetical protein